MQNGIKINKIKSFIAKMNRYDLFLWVFLFAYLIFYILLLKKYLLRDWDIFFGRGGKSFFIDFIHTFSSLV